MYVYVPHVCLGPVEVEVDVVFSGTRVKDGCELQRRLCECNPGTL